MKKYTTAQHLKINMKTIKLFSLRVTHCVKFTVIGIKVLLKINSRHQNVDRSRELSK